MECEKKILSNFRDAEAANIKSIPLRKKEWQKELCSFILSQWHDREGIKGNVSQQRRIS